VPEEVTRTGPAREGLVATASPIATGQPGAARAPSHPGPRRRARSWLRRGREPLPSTRPDLRDGLVTEPPAELSADDPLAGYLSRAAGAVDIRHLDLDSPALKALRDAGVVLVVPLISGGSSIGLLALGPRKSERDYTTDDRGLLNALASYAAPALRVGQLVRDQQEQALRRERIDQQLNVARLVQRQFLPASPPDLPGWRMAAYYSPALRVGGDFYDFIALPGGRVMVVFGDVADKGVPAALVMASTHALLRAAAPRLVSPGAVLEQVNELLCDDTPAQIFVTCFALVLHGESGQVTFANAGHDVPYVRTARGVAELRAKGMPLGLMPGMTYEEKTFRFQAGDRALVYSDGLSEAHGPGREMFGFHRVAALAGRGASTQELLDVCLRELSAFTGPGYEQEDDITLLSLERTMPERTATPHPGGGS